MLCVRSSFHVSRRRLLQVGLGATLATTTTTLPRLSRALAQEDIQDEDIFQFALNLEYMEAEYYLRGTTGKGIDDADAGPEAGDVVGGKQFRSIRPPLANS